MAEARKRKGRPLHEWVKAEREAVWRAARNYAQQRALRVPTIGEVMSCERYAMGSVDYGAKWAYGVARVMRDADGADSANGGRQGGAAGQRSASGAWS